MEIEIVNRQKRIRLSLKRIKTRTEEILRTLGLKDGSLSIVFTDDYRIRKINREYLGRNAATDVLAFSMIEGKRIGDRHLLGDVVISVDTAARCAGHLKRSIEEELLLYLTHGILHLIGYRDKNQDERKLMEKLQGRILERISQHPRSRV